MDHQTLEVTSQLYKYLPAERINDVLLRHRLRFAPLWALNDPFEHDKKLDDAFVDDKVSVLRAGPFPDFGTIHRKDGTEKCDPGVLFRGLFVGVGLCNWGVLSLSRSPTNILMWAHYSGELSGFVLGLNKNSSYLGGGNNPPLAVNYSSVRSTENGLEQRNLIEKPIQWAYEEEVRAFRVIPTGLLLERESGGDIEKTLFKFDREDVVSIYVGINSSAVSRRQIHAALLSWGTNSRPRLLVVEPCGFNYELTAKEIAPHKLLNNLWGLTCTVEE